MVLRALTRRRMRIVRLRRVSGVARSGLRLVSESEGVIISAGIALQIEGRALALLHQELRAEVDMTLAGVPFAIVARRALNFLPTMVINEGRISFPQTVDV